jgi:predicted nicotinamide N-methyase
MIPATPIPAIKRGIPATKRGRRDFIVANTRLQRPPHVAEIQLHLADEITPIWKLTEEALEEIGLPPPFWAFAWAGGQALARYLIDHPQTVVGKRVIDFAAGSGLVGIGAMMAGARDVLCADIDPYCEAAVALNAQVNGVACAFTAADLLEAPAPAWAEVILAGDICYEKPLAERVLAWLAAARAGGAVVLIGDPGRSYFPRSGLTRLAEYQVPTTRALEDMAVKRTSVWALP